jgi:hypothetical protein
VADSLLPPEFADLEDFVSDWALPNEKLRQAKRINDDLQNVRGFYEAMLPRMPAVYDYLEKISHGDVARLSEPQRRLYQLGCAFIEASHPIEMRWQRTDIDDAFPLDRLGFLSPSNHR